MLRQADQLHRQERLDEAEPLLREAFARAGTPKEKAEAAWRLSRNILWLAEFLSEQGKLKEREAQARYEEGERLADLSIELDPAGYMGWFLKAAHIGKQAQIRGVLSSLANAKPMLGLLETAVSLEPGHAQSWFVLSQLYGKVPRPPLSFGDRAAAVSFGRFASILHERDLREGREHERIFDYRVELAARLHDRDWSAAERRREHAKLSIAYRNTAETLERNRYFEGSVDLPEESDREEAFRLLSSVIAEVERLSAPSERQKRDYRKALELRKEWKR